MRAKDDYMQERDSPSLRYFGFEAGWSGTTWFGVDREGQMWQAISNYNDAYDTYLYFRKYYGVKGTDGAKPMTKETFIKTFKVLHD